jgi:hypothetical protein
MMVDGIPLTQLLEEYDRQCAVSNEILTVHSLRTRASTPVFLLLLGPSCGCCFTWSRRPPGTPVTWSAIRELLDGEKGSTEREPCSPVVSAHSGWTGLRRVKL